MAVEKKIKKRPGAPRGNKNAAEVIKMDCVFMGCIRMYPWLYLEIQKYLEKHKTTASKFAREAMLEKIEREEGG